MSAAAGTVSVFARQALLPGWDQARVATARVLIAGVGALGNACAVDLALTGVGRLALVDFDHIETSNLSRTVLFRQGDEGRPKALVAAERLKPMMLAVDPAVVPFDCDIVWDLGWGVYRRADLILGCVDSSEARAAVGMAAWALGVPAVFGGLYAYDGSVTIQGIGSGPCVACGFSSAEWADWSRRHSCDHVRRAFLAEARVPTTQITSSLIGALMAQEGLSLLHGDRRQAGTRLFVAGRRPVIERVRVTQKPRCPFHAQITAVEEDSSLSSRMTARALLAGLAPWGAPVTARLGREFLVSCRCKGCGTGLRLWRPRHRTASDDLICASCRRTTRPLAGDPDIAGIHELSSATDPALLDMTLEDLGVPPLHVLEVEGGRRAGWVELTGDLRATLPRWGAPSEEEARR